MLSNPSASPSLKIFPLGDQAIVIEFGSTIDEAVHTQVMAFADYLEKHPFKSMIEYVPAFSSVTIYYDPWLASNGGEQDAYEVIKELILQCHPKIETLEKQKSRTVEIPVCYGGELGPDLPFVASYTGLTQEEVIAIHTKSQYLVYMIGFAPGFPYLGGMDPRIAAPRKDTPRYSIPSGSVGIAGKQTGIYPIDTPGGWQLIGCTPLSLFDPARQPPCFVKAGELIRFVPITEEAYYLAKKGAEE